MATLNDNANAVSACATAIDAAITAKGGTLVGGGKLRNAVAGIQSIPTGGGTEYPVAWKNDGKTHIWIRTEKENSKLYITNFRVYNQSGENVLLDYGDGTSEQFPVYGIDKFADINVNHTYAASGHYEVILSNYDSFKIRGQMFRGVDEGNYTYPTPKYADSLYSVKQLELAKVFEIGSSSQQRLDTLVAVKIDDDSTITSLGQRAFSSCAMLKTVTLPSTITSIGVESFGYCNSLTSVGNNRFDSIGSYAFNSCFMYADLDLSSCTSLGNNSIDTMGIENAAINVGAIPTGICRQCYNLKTIDIGSSCTSIGQYSCTVVPLLQYLVCRATTPPTAGTGFMQQFPTTAKVYVPYSADHSILNAYKAATNWSLRAGQMYELNEDGTIPTGA